MPWLNTPLFLLPLHNTSYNKARSVSPKIPLITRLGKEKKRKERKGKEKQKKSKRKERERKEIGMSSSS